MQSHDLQNNLAYINCFPNFLIESSFEWLNSFAEVLSSKGIIAYFDLNGINSINFSEKISNYPNLKIYNNLESYSFNFFLLLSKEGNIHSDFIPLTPEIDFSKFELTKLKPLSLEIINKKIALINKKIDSIKDHNMNSSQTERYIQSATRFLNQIHNFNPLSTKEFETLIFYEIYKICLRAEVEINYALHPQIDPVIGWIDMNKDLKSETVLLSNPFIGVELFKTGSVKSLDYFPRKFSLNSFIPFLFFDTTANSKTERAEKDSLLPEPILMRRNPDLYALKFSEIVNFNEIKSESLNIFKTFYIHSGLVPLGNYSTTGYHVDFWADSENSNINLFSNKKLYLNLNQFLLCESNLVRIRALTAMGGLSDKVFQLENTNKLIINKKSVDGGLQGIRLIDSVNQLVIDYRYSQILEQIEIEIDNLTQIQSSITKFSYLINSSELFSPKLSSINVSIY